MGYLERDLIGGCAWKLCLLDPETSKKLGYGNDREVGWKFKGERTVGSHRSQKQTARRTILSSFKQDFPQKNVI